MDREKVAIKCLKNLRIEALVLRDTAKTEQGRCLVESVANFIAKTINELEKIN